MASSNHSGEPEKKHKQSYNTSYAIKKSLKRELKRCIARYISSYSSDSDWLLSTTECGNLGEVGVNHQGNQNQNKHQTSKAFAMY